MIIIAHHKFCLQQRSQIDNGDLQQKEVLKIVALSAIMKYYYL